MMKTIVMILIATFACESWAAKLPSESELSSEISRVEIQRKQMFSASAPMSVKAGSRLPTAKEISQEQARIEIERKGMFENAKIAPNYFPNIPTPPSSGVDIETLAKQYSQKASARKMDDLIVFVSFSVPVESLKRLITQANQIGATVVFRGFKDGSMLGMAKDVNGMGVSSANIQINPNAFTKYKINVVPSFVLAKADAIDQLDDSGCAPAGNYVSVSGDVSIDYALDAISRQSPEFRELANQYVRQFRGR